MEHDELTRCTGCKYYRSISGYIWMNDYACHYCIDTGKVRGYPAKDCYLHDGTAYAPKEKEKPIRKEPSVLSKRDLIRKLTGIKNNLRSE